ncbi:MAG TPA: hypothetical protein VHI32_03415 [Burkholderiales bacterium]|jgi:hypothetical protein|nr:hypothetical protein [Burkholderiales bacterium]
MHRRAFIGPVAATALASPRVLFAQASGIALPHHLLIRADRVIE